MDRRMEEKNGPTEGEEVTERQRQVAVSRSRPVRYLLITLGTVSMVLGFIGIFLPIMPTTPFLLVAAACYARGSKRFYDWLLSNRWFGKYIVVWRMEHRIPLHAKVLAVIMISVSVGTSIVFFVPITVVKILLAVVAMWVIIYICRQKS